MKDLFSLKKVASIVSLPKKSVLKVLRHKMLTTTSGAITQTGLESGYVTEVRVARFESGISFDETHLRVTTKGVLMLIQVLTSDTEEVCHG